MSNQIPPKIAYRSVKNLTTTFFFLLVLLSGGKARGQCWEEINFPIRGQNDVMYLLDINITNDSTVFLHVEEDVAVNDYLFKSTDLGNSWSLVFQDRDTSNGNRVNRLINVKDTVWVYTNKFLLKSFDSGMHWDTIYYNSSSRPNLRHYSFINGQTGFGFQHLFHIYKTMNGGMRWTKVAEVRDTIPFRDIGGVYFKDENKGWIFGSHIIETNDGGATWDFVKHPFYFDNLRTGVCFDSSNILFTGSGNPSGSWYLSQDAGATWSYKRLANGIQVWDIRPLDESRAWLVGNWGLDGTIFFTRNKGESFTISQKFRGPINPSRFISLDFWGDSVGFAGTFNPGFLFRYKPGLSGCNFQITSHLPDAIIKSGDTIHWTKPRGCSVGFYLSIGTAQGATDILQKIDVGFDTSFVLPVLPFDTTVFIQITPYGPKDEQPNCGSFSFRTEKTVSTQTVISASPVQIYPNPTREGFWIQSEKLMEVARLKLTDVQGRIIPLPLPSEVVLPDNRYWLDAAALRPGVYFLRFEYDGHFFSKKLILLP